MDPCCKNCATCPDAMRPLNEQLRECVVWCIPENNYHLLTDECFMKGAEEDGGGTKCLA